MSTPLFTLYHTFRTLFFPKTKKGVFITNLSAQDISLVAHPLFTKKKIYSFFPYNNALILLLIKALKFEKEKHAGILLGKSCAPFFAEYIAEKRSFGFYSPLYIIPIPLHKKRKDERGYNQTEIILHALFKEMDDTSFLYRNDILIRKKYTKAHSLTSSKKERERNIKDAFFVEEKKKKDIQGKDVLIFDDVTTTGSTLLEAKKTLKNAGARKVLLVALAH
jgi:ComF family protein